MQLPNPPTPDHLKIRIGQWFDAAAQGRLALVGVILAILLLALALVFG